MSENGEESSMGPNSTNDMHEENSNKVMEIPDGGNVKPKQEEPIEQPRSTRVRGGCKGRTVAEHPHYTRSKNNTRDIAMAVESRPPKPNLPSSREAARDPRWWAADKREVDKLVEESVFTPLPRDEMGKYIFPEGAIFMNMFRRREIKWKPLPEDAASEGWVECMRLVGDGSTDTRDVHYYAETPDRTLLLMSISIGATLNEYSATADVSRAYLNADSIDRNIVMVAPDDLVGLEKYSLLNKALYGTKGGALSWELWIDAKLKGNGLRKCDVARGMYLHGQSGDMVRLLRHSDDFRVAAASKKELERVC